jgi:hypothetical protein
MTFTHTPWTKEVAYAVGLITTDGNLSPDKRHISITSRDKKLLYTFRKCLNITNRITKNIHGSYSKECCYRIQFGSVVFYRWLLSIGLMPNKSFKLKKIKIPDRFIADFLRGHIDGDGSIITYKDTYNTDKNPDYIYDRLYICFLSGSRKHIIWISEKIKKLLKITVDISISNKKVKKPIWKLRYAKKASQKLLKFIYYRSDLPCLKRKRKIAEKFMI